jgi:hypothetical protein
MVWMGVYPNGFHLGVHMNTKRPTNKTFCIIGCCRRDYSLHIILDALLSYAGMEYSPEENRDYALPSIWRDRLRAQANWLPSLHEIILP